jgi:hypothetical protein
MVTGWGKMGGEGEGSGKEWIRKGRKSGWKESNGF